VKRFKTLEDYVSAALATARFEKIENGQKVYAEIPAFRGVWAQGHTREDAISELRETLEGWVELQLERGQELPSVNGMKFEELTFA
jgi:predicted RNase H-like HicB family nuclease